MAAGTHASRIIDNSASGIVRDVTLVKELRVRWVRAKWSGRVGVNGAPRTEALGGRAWSGAGAGTIAGLVVLVVVVMHGTGPQGGTAGCSRRGPDATVVAVMAAMMVVMVLTDVLIMRIAIKRSAGPVTLGCRPGTSSQSIAAWVLMVSRISCTRMMLMMLMQCARTQSSTTSGRRGGTHAIARVVIRLDRRAR